MKCFVCESLDQFIKEWVDPAEDRWANRQIDKFKKRESGIDVETDPEEILSNPDEVVSPSIENLPDILPKIIEYKKDQEVTPEEFSNFCYWITKLQEKPETILNAISYFIEKNPKLISALKSEPPDGGKFNRGFEIIANKFKGKGT
jgi:hypothetical protein